MRHALLFVLLLAGCAPATAPVSPAPATAAAADTLRPMPNDIHWFRNAIEYRIVAREVYAIATEQVTRQASSLPRGGWAVILDADETVLDNSEYQRRIAARGLKYDPKTWDPWVREKAATAVPGAAEFTQTVRRLGGRIVIVTNRDEPVCAPTEENLRTAGIAADAVLCRPVPTQSDKNPRFRAVAEGTTGKGLPALQVIAFVGDNIRDFPGLDQNSPAGALGAFGTTYFMLPNPMYGSWESLPRK